MRTYWDYSEKERSEMKREEVEALLDVELMTKGVKKIDAPILKPIKKVEVATEIWFEVDGVFFKTAELAQQFLVLDPRKSTYEYGCGYDYHYACEIELKIKQTTLYSRQELLNLSTVLKENKAAKEYNESASSVYEKQEKEVNRVLSGVWEDWYQCQEKAEKHKRVFTTAAEYLKLTNEDQDLADAFLKKVFSEEEIREANTWFDKDEEGVEL